MENKAALGAEIKPKQVVWLLDDKLELCIECQKLVKAEKKMLMKGFCRTVENGEGKSFAARSTQAMGKEYRDPKQYKKEEDQDIAKHKQKVPVRAIERQHFVVL